MNTRTVLLTTPVTANGFEIAEVTLRPLKVRDLVQVNRAGGDDFERSINLLAAAAGLPRETIDDIDMNDLGTLNEALESILGKSASSASGKPS